MVSFGQKGLKYFRRNIEIKEEEVLMKLNI